MGSKPWKFTNIFLDPAWMDTVPNLWRPASETFPQTTFWGDRFYHPPSLSPLISQVKPGPSSKYPVPPHGSVPTIFHSVNPPPSRKIHHTRRGFTKSQVNGRDHGRFVVLLMKQPEISVDFFDRKKSSFGIENFNYLVLMAKNLTIFLGWLLNHPLKNPCI